VSSSNQEKFVPCLWLLISILLSKDGQIITYFLPY
jgi:hypothetical protein